MKKQYIEFKCLHQKLERTDNFYVVGGSQKYLYAKFDFCEDWRDEEQYAVFTGGGNTFRIEIVNGECEVPWEMLLTKRFFVGCEAGQRITSNAVEVEVNICGAPEETDTPRKPTPTLQSQIGDLAKLATKAKESLVAAINEVFSTYLPLKGGKLTGKLLTRDVRVGGDYDENGDWSPDLGGGKSRLAVSGTLELHGEVKAENSSFKTKHMNVGGEMKVEGDTRLKGQAKIDQSLEVGTELKVGGRLKMKNGSTLDMNGGDVKNVQSMEVEGTANFQNDVQIKHNTNRDHTVKLSTVLDEALDYGFKSRIYVDKMPGTTFTEQIENAYAEVADGGTIVITASDTEYILDTELWLSKSVRFLGVGATKPVIRFSDPFWLNGCANAIFENLHLIGDNSGGAVIRDYAGADPNPLEYLRIYKCQIDYNGTFIRFELDGAYNIEILNSEINGTNDHCNISTAQMQRLYIANSYLDGGNSSDGGTANIVTGAEDILLEGCRIVAYSHALEPTENTKSLTAINCTLSEDGELRLLGWYENRISSVVTVGGNLGLQMNYSNRDGLSRVVTQADLDTALGVIENGSY